MIFGKRKETKQNISDRIKDNLLEINYGDPAIFTNGKANYFLDLKPILDNKTLSDFLWGKEEKLILTNNKDLLSDISEQIERADSINDLIDLCNQCEITLSPKDHSLWKIICRWFNSFWCS